MKLVQLVCVCMWVYVWRKQWIICVCMLSFQTTGYDKYAFNSLEIGFVIIFYAFPAASLATHIMCNFQWPCKKFVRHELINIHYIFSKLFFAALDGN